MNRRDFLTSGAALSACLAGPVRQLCFAESASSGRRLYEVTTRVEILKYSGTTRVWLPVAMSGNVPFQQTLKSEFSAGGGNARIVKGGADELGIVAAEYPAGAKPVLTLTLLVSTKNYAVDVSKPGKNERADPKELNYFLRSTRLLPTDGIVKATAQEITRGTKTDIDKARAIYDWVVENAVRDPKTQGCGRGDIRFMLESKDLRGKCADINALYVGLARAAGIPARDVYGIRTVKSELGYKSLGASSANVTKAQHCRAEVYLSDYGWVPVDPADVRKVVLEEPPGNRSLDDEMVSKARARLFGSWEMNWIAYNFAHDVELPGSAGAPIGFLMYPQAETNGGRLDALDAESFRYEITSREIAVENG